jgi:hypothetical protein
MTYLGRAVPVVVLQRLRIVFSFITKVFPKCVYRGIIFDQAIPIVMTHFVAEMSE